MHKILIWFNQEKTKHIMRAFDIVIMLILLYIYLLKADLSTAPEFIYNQF